MHKFVYETENTNEQSHHNSMLSPYATFLKKCGSRWNTSNLFHNWMKSQASIYGQNPEHLAWALNSNMYLYDPDSNGISFISRSEELGAEST
jgi:hypothetical protein